MNDRISVGIALPLGLGRPAGEHGTARTSCVYKLREKALKLRCSVEIITKSQCCLCFGVCILVRFFITVKCLVKNSTTCQTTYSAQSAIIKIIGIFTIVV